MKRDILYEYFCCIVICRIHIDTIIKTSEDFFKKKYTSHFIWKVCVWEGVGDQTELQYIDPHSYGHQRCVFLVLQGCSTGGLWAHSAECGLSLLHLVTNCPGLQTHRLPAFTELYNSSIAHSVSPHNWPLGCVTSAVLGMACLIVIEWKELSCSSQVTLFWCISLWLYRGILPCPILLAKLAHANGICTSAVFGMACLARLKVNIQHFFFSLTHSHPDVYRLYGNFSDLAMFA